MNSTITANILRFLGLVVLQVLVFKRLSFEWENFNYISIIIYPIFILLLPIRTPHALLVFIAFLLGLTIDIFYDSIGVHASAAVWTAFIRPYVLKAIAPRGGYNLNFGLTKHRLGLNWFFTYSSIMMLAHLAWYFSVNAFTFYYISDILLRTIFSFIISMIFVIMYQYLLDPRD